MVNVCKCIIVIITIYLLNFFQRVLFFFILYYYVLLCIIIIMYLFSVWSVVFLTLSLQKQSKTICYLEKWVGKKTIERESCRDRNVLWWMSGSRSWNQKKKKKNKGSRPECWWYPNSNTSAANPRAPPPPRCRGTCAVVEMELVGVVAVQAEGDLPVGPGVRVRGRDLQHEGAGGRVLHHRAGVQQLEEKDNHQEAVGFCTRHFTGPSRCGEKVEQRRILKASITTSDMKDAPCRIHLTM